MSSIYDNLRPPQEGEFPDWFKFYNAGDTIEGQITDVRVGKPSDAGEDPYPIIQIRKADGTEHSVACGATSLYRQVYALRPEAGGMIRLTFTGHSGRAKIFDVQYQAAAGTAPAPATPPMAVPAPAIGYNAPAPAPAAPPWGP